MREEFDERGRVQWKKGGLEKKLAAGFSLTGGFSLPGVAFAFLTLMW